ncbi:hypothetical protein SELMODRAFT_414977 [Selaginella moellendorffii]|uniref:Uncharacterized protein n=1 Tax=Selaginella moellendorffii TaxID=88036 RepID=D8RU72_SELML|nr:hypothetical protein SELMODRAFT_414977 [Selaginella moellendorffii]
MKNQVKLVAQSALIAMATFIRIWGQVLSPFQLFVTSAHNKELEALVKLMPRPSKWSVSAIVLTQQYARWRWYRTGVAQNPVSPTTANNCTNHKRDVKYGPQSSELIWKEVMAPLVVPIGDEVINYKIEDVVEEVKTITSGNMAYDAIGGALSKELFDTQELTTKIKQ